MPVELKKLRGGRNDEVIEMLQGLLDRAQKGEIIEIITFFKHADDASWGHEWTGCNDLLRLVGYLEAIKQQQLARATT